MNIPSIKRIFLSSLVMGFCGFWAILKIQADSKDIKVENITATSEQAPDDDYLYSASNVMDGTVKYSWVEGKADDGIGESVKITLSKAVKIPVIRILNGFGNAKYWAAKNRVKDLIISTDSGHKKTVTLHDIMVPQTIPLPGGFKARVITLTIGSVYKGKKSPETAIAEISLGFGFKDNGDGTIYDPLSNLTWMKCALGQSGNDCQGNGKKFTWQAAIDACDDLKWAEKKDWRLPEKEELATLIYCSNGVVTPEIDYKSCGTWEKFARPAVDQNLFPNTRPSQYWSATTYANIKASAWYSSFYYGYVHGYYKTAPAYARCVRSGK